MLRNCVLICFSYAWFFACTICEKKANDTKLVSEPTRDNSNDMLNPSKRAPGAHSEGLGLKDEFEKK